MRVLIVEDEIKMASLIRRGLRKEGMAADVATKGLDALWMAEASEYDVIVLDVMLPDIDGFEVCRRLRSNDVWAPIVMLTARDSIRDRVTGLDSGADDYLTKPFSYAELLARLRALVRRGPVEHPTELVVGDLRLDPAARRVHRGEVEVELSAKEFAILETFMRRPGEVLTRLQLLEHAWDYSYENRSNVVDSYVRFLAQEDRQAIRARLAGDDPRGRLPVAGRLRATGTTMRADPDPDPDHPRLRVGDGGAADRARALRLPAIRRSAQPHDQHRTAIASPGDRLVRAPERRSARDREGAPLIENDESFAQIQARSGAVLDSSPQLAARSLLSPTELGRATRQGSLRLERSGVHPIEARCACSPCP